MKFVEDDGGRAAAGFRGTAGDCVCRAIAIASGLPYKEIYRELALGRGNQRATKRSKKRSRSARDGIAVRRLWFKDYMHGLGFKWVPCMAIGTGCNVHLADGELPAGNRLVVSVSKHYTAVINGVIHDTHDPQRDGTRCVYGYWILRRAPTLSPASSHQA